MSYLGGIVTRRHLYVAFVSHEMKVETVLRGGIRPFRSLMAVASAVERSFSSHCDWLQEHQRGMRME